MTICSHNRARPTDEPSDQVRAGYHFGERRAGIGDRGVYRRTRHHQQHPGLTASGHGTGDRGPGRTTINHQAAHNPASNPRHDLREIVPTPAAARSRLGESDRSLQRRCGSIRTSACVAGAPDGCCGPDSPCLLSLGGHGLGIGSLTSQIWPVSGLGSLASRLSADARGVISVPDLSMVVKRSWSDGPICSRGCSRM